LTKRRTTRLIKKKAKQGMDGCIFEIAFKSEDLKDLQKQDLINESGRNYGNVEIKNGKVILALILPKFIRENNVQQFTLMDSIYLELIKNDVEEKLKQILGTTKLDNNKCSCIEVNITQRVSGNATQDNVLNLLSNALLSKKQDNLKYVGPSKKSRLKEETHTLIVKRSHYYLLKAYNKSEQMMKSGIKIPDGMLRIEIVMVERTLEKLFGNKTSFQDILTKDSLISVLREYKRIFVDEIIEEKVKVYLDSCKLMLLESLCFSDSVVEVIAKNRELIPDKEVLRKAIKRFQRMKRVADHSKRDSELYSQKYGLPEDTILTLKEFKDSCG
jgi:hypothetical protein